MDNAIARLEWLLTRLELLDSPDRESEEKKQLYQEICKLAFEDQLYVRIWSEPTLNRLNQLFQTEKPGEELFDAELEEIRKRTIAVKEVNNLFFSIVDPTTTIKDHCELLAKFECLPKNFIERLDASGRLQEIRNQDRCTFGKVTCFLEILKDDFNLDLTTKDSIKGTLESLKSRETVGTVNALLVQEATKAIAVSLHVKLQAGSGQVCCQISGSDDFKEAVARAQSAMRDRGSLSGSEDIFYSLELTDARYHGSSLAVAAAVAMHDVRLNLATDPYTAFTGDINLDGQEWAIKPVSGVSQKIIAAKRAGCRRVFIPSLNCTEVTAPPDVKIFGVDSLTNLFIQLRPGRQLLPSGSLQGRKVTSLQQYCMNHGWDLSPPQPIQAGIQFSIVPLEIPPLKVQIYNTGTHTPKTTSQNEYLELLSILNATDPSQKHMVLDWYRKEVIWTLIQGKLRVMDDTASVPEVVSVAKSILALEPKDYSARWRTVHPVLKTAGGLKQWDIVFEWAEKVTPDELSTTPMKDDRERDGWCERAVWYNYRIRSMIEVGDREQATKLALDAAKLFPRQAKFFKRLEALAQLRLGRFAEAELLYGKLTIGGRPDWWILKEHGHVLRELGRSQDALTAMSKAALSNRKLEAMVSLFSDIGFLCRQTNLKQDARNHLLLSKHIREKHGWAVSQAISVGLIELNQELSDLPGPEDFDRVLAECQRFWRRTVGAQYDSREPSLKSRGVKRTVKGKLKLGPPERPYCFLHSDTRESYFCLKSDLPNGVTDGVTLQFDALPSFDKKKKQESWKAVNVRTM